MSLALQSVFAEFKKPPRDVPRAGEKPIIKIRADQSAMNDEALAVLATCDVFICDGATRPVFFRNGDCEYFNATSLKEVLSSVVEYQTPTGRPKPPPSVNVRQILARRRYPELRVLRHYGGWDNVTWFGDGVCQVSDPGYDPETHIYYYDTFDAEKLFVAAQLAGYNPKPQSPTSYTFQVATRRVLPDFVDAYRRQQRRS